MRVLHGKFQESLPAATIHNITRVHNMCQWEYFLEKKWLEEKNQGIIKNWNSFIGVRELILCASVVPKKDLDV